MDIEPLKQLALFDIGRFQFYWNFTEEGNKTNEVDCIVSCHNEDETPECVGQYCLVSHPRLINRSRTHCF